MPYSGADVLAHLSELARQRAELPRISTVLVISRLEATGELIQSALRAVVGYEADIVVCPNVAEAIRTLRDRQPQIAFICDDKHLAIEWFQATAQSIRKAGLACPLAFILEHVSSQLRCQLLDIGALDVFHRDEVCGLRLRESLLKLAVQTPDASAVP